MAETAREKYRTQLKNHTRKHFFIKQEGRSECWKVSCWLGKEPTGRLFEINHSYKEQNLNDSLDQLANDMWTYLFTKTGEEIMKAEYEKEHGKS